MAETTSEELEERLYSKEKYSMDSMFNYLFEFCHSVFKHLDDKFIYSILQTKLSIWIKIKYNGGYEIPEFTFTYSPVDYLEFGKINKRLMYNDFIKDIGTVISTIEHMKLD